MIVPLTKSPFPPKGRTGKLVWQDWFQGCLEAMRFSIIIPDSLVYVISNVHVKNAPHEADLYSAVFDIMDVQTEVVREAQETIEQIDIAFNLAEKNNSNIIFIATGLHFPRVWWLCKRKKSTVRYQIKAVWGLPRWKECVTDILLSFIFPIIDLLGKRGWFQRYTEERRRKGIQ